MMSGQFKFTTFRSTPNSPKLADEFIGMKIAAIESVLEIDQREIMIHGSHRFKAAFRNRFESLSHEIAIVCVDAATHIPVVENLQNEGFETPRFKSKYDENDPGFDETTIASWFNTRVSLPTNPPFSEAGYHIFAIIGDQKSNVLRIRRKVK